MFYCSRPWLLISYEEHPQSTRRHAFVVLYLLRYCIEARGTCYYGKNLKRNLQVNHKLDIPAHFQSKQLGHLPTRTSGLAALPDGLDRADRSKVRVTMPQSHGGQKRNMVREGLLLPKFTIYDLRRRRRELSASFLDAFPGAWLAWLSLSVDGGGRAQHE